MANRKPLVQIAGQIQELPTTDVLDGVAAIIGFKNKIIGGDFTINPWQRGTSFPAIGGGTYSADRWIFRCTSAAAGITASKAADAPTAGQAGIFTQHCLSLAVTTADTVIDAGDRYSVAQFIEGLNAASFGFGQVGSRNVTLSFWVKGTKTGIHCIRIMNSAGDRSYVAEYTINVTNTWEYKTITIPVDTTGTWLYDTGIGMRVDFALMAGTTFQTTANTWADGEFFATANQVNALDSTANVFKLALVQLEAGSVATSFDVRSVGQELALCQRYYEKSYDINVAPGAVSNFGARLLIIPVASQFPVAGLLYTRKRGAPTITIYSPSGTANRVWDVNDTDYATALSASNHVSETSVRYFTFAASIEVGNYMYHFTASAEL